MSEALAKYYELLGQAQSAEMIKMGTEAIRRLDNPPYTINTLWVPFLSGNRTACVNLNHELHGFDENGYLRGANSNCGMGYIILEFPFVDELEDKLQLLAQRVKKRLNKPDSYPAIRSLKADERLPMIEEEIRKMVEKEEQ